MNRTMIKKRLSYSLSLLKIYGLPLLAIAGIFMGVRTVRAGSTPRPVGAPLIEPAVAPFPRYVAGSGIIESSDRNINIASPRSGLIKEVFVDVGSHVKQGDPLFALDDRALRAEQLVRNAQIETSKAQLAQALSQLKLIQNLSDKRAVSTDEVIQRQNAVSIAQAQLKQSEALLAQNATDLEVSTVTAPREGEVLQANIRAGEFASAQNNASPLMILGNDSTLWVRADIDENNAWRIDKNLRAVASLRGNKEIRTDLSFVKFERYVIPKKSLTGDSAERVDTRVLQVIYSFPRGDLPVFAGQLMDVYIEAER